jgi:hypothetical protein
LHDLVLDRVGGRGAAAAAAAGLRLRQDARAVGPVDAQADGLGPVAKSLRLRLLVHGLAVPPVGLLLRLVLRQS